MSDSPDVTARLDALEATVAGLVARNERLEADNVRLRRASTPRSAAVADPPGGPAALPSGPTLGRRNVLGRGLAVAGAAAAGAVLLDAAPAAAADGGPMILGTTNAASGTTTLTGSGGVVAFYATTTTGYSLYAQATGTGTPLLVSGPVRHMRFSRNNGRVPPIEDTVDHERGEVVMDAYSNLWYCTGDGTPGTWTTLAGNGSTGAFFPLPAPVRIYDSRTGTTPAQGPKTPLAGTRTIDLTVNASTLSTASRTAVVNVLLVNAANANGNFTIWASGQPKPQANSLVWGGSAGRFSTLAITRLGAGKVQINASHPTDIVLDVVGHYF